MSEHEKEFEQLFVLFLNLNRLMEADGERNWTRGIIACLGALDTSKDSILSGLKEAKAIYGGMHVGSGSFSDYCIWDDDPRKRK